ncbi:MAG: HAMP domain-containing sensor histidine kinase, partial [Caulobacteraceae bacterium]
MGFASIGRRFTGVRWAFARTGVRLALLNAAVVVVAFALAGCFSLLSIQRLSRADMRDRLRGEAVSMEDEFRQKGSAHLSHTVAKRTRLWRGFEYRLTDPAGIYRGGRLPGGEALGWAEARGVKFADGPGARSFLMFSERMPDGSVLSVGQDLSVEAQQMAATARSLLLAGLVGVGFCLCVAYAFNRRTWRLIARISEAARQVTDGRLDVRVATRPGTPHDDIEELGQAFNGMLGRIGVLLEQLRQVTVDIAHDMRTPLTRVHQKLERLEARAAHDPALVGEVKSVEADIAEVLRTFDALLQLSEIGGQKGGSADPLVDLGEIAERVAEAFRPDIEESGRSLEVHCPSAQVRGDGHLLSQVVANLLENALRYTPAGARIAVEVTEGEAPRLRVRDDGPGIPADARGAVLKPFVRLEPSRHMPGSGLGLSIVSAIAARHQARLSLTDRAPGLQVE